MRLVVLSGVAAASAAAFGKLAFGDALTLHFAHQPVSGWVCRARAACLIDCALWMFTITKSLRNAPSWLPDPTSFVPVH